jgi:predicted Zn-dependent protease
MFEILTAIGQFIYKVLYAIRWFLVVVLAIGLPLFLYLTFAKEPVFAVENDVELGKQTVASIAADPEQYPLLSEEEYPEAYERMRRLVDRVVQSPEVQHRDLFAYNDVKIIHDDSVLNAFCAPGGYIYVFSGLMRYLDHEDHLAGVLGHEIAHAENRHSAIRLQKEYGSQALLDFILLASPVGVGDVIRANILKDLLGLGYSRDQEAQSDQDSVSYLATSGYACDGTAGFFAKLLDEGQDVKIPEWMSDHPASQARVDDVRRVAAELGCSTELGDQSEWRAFQASLPPVQGDETEGSEEAGGEGAEPSEPTP